MDKSITRSDLKFWITIMAMLVTFTIAFTSLRKDVEAMTKREQLNKEMFADICVIVNETHDAVIRMEQKQNQLIADLKSYK